MTEAYLRYAARKEEAVDPQDRRRGGSYKFFLKNGWGGPICAYLEINYSAYFQILPSLSESKTI